MHWKVKAYIQRSLAMLPSDASYAIYYWAQRHCGNLRRVSPISRIRDGIATWDHLLAAGREPVGAVFCEVGTGRVPTIPMAYWLMGAARTITVDLHPYLAPELVRESLEYVATHQTEIAGLFGGRLHHDRFARLITFLARMPFSVSEYLDLCQITYIAPCDAAATGLPDTCVDIHTSFAVLEHVPPEGVAGILREARRVLRPHGLCVHRIDYGDHFSYDDRRISVINFLRYSDARWDQLAGNRYMYMNRLRHDDYLAIYARAGHQIQTVTTYAHPSAAAALQGGLPLDARFAGKPQEVLSTTGAWIVSAPVQSLSAT